MPIPLNPLEGFGSAAHAWSNLSQLALSWILLFIVTAIGTVAAKAKLAQRRQSLPCPEEDGASAVIYPVRDANRLPVDIDACSLRPGEQPVRCGKSCLTEAA